MKIAGDGNVECWSDNGHDCAWGANDAALVASNTEPKQPLVCGCQCKASWGFTGYCDGSGNYSPNHWCNVVKTALGATPSNPACSPAPVLALNLAVATNADAPNNTLLVFLSTMTGAGLALAAVALNNYRRRIPSTKEERHIIL
ncbi:Aste57867_3917 [Aphanomyces stellatus]|uniref:Aste57867_3917 protein n=1 Tax=Aphanomyces stellatus TaxID=120398 RepID=A0A485KAJ3_9STRA|nr:hypothetical protein As57867_003906 [Aphanomyces stellatus]VFT81056.1 Aste57867_3917 [Aphanomyces stellatus]